MVLFFVSIFISYNTEQVKPDSMRRKIVDIEYGDEILDKHHTYKYIGTEPSIDKVIKVL